MNILQFVLLRRAAFGCYLPSNTFARDLVGCVVSSCEEIYSERRLVSGKTNVDDDG